MATYNRRMLTFTSILCLTGSVITQDQFEMTTVLGSSATFTCTVDVTAQAAWRDVTNNNLIIYSMDLQRQPVKTQDAQTDDKYMYYTAALVDSTKFNLLITSVNVTDVGALQCIQFPSNSLLTEFTITVEAKVEQVTIDCISPCDNLVDGAVEVLETTDCQCTCTGNGGYPNSLLLEWNKGVPGSQVIDESSSGPYGTYDYSRSVTFTPERNYSPLICQFEGYTHESVTGSSDIRSEVSFNVLYAPVCILEIKNGAVGDNSCSLMLACTCDANPEMTAGDYLYFNGNDPIGGNDNTTTANLGLESTAEFSCRGGNDVGTGDRSPGEVYLCSSFTTMSPTKLFTIASHGSTSHSITPGDKTCRDGPNRSSTALIVICCVEGVVIIAMVFVIGFLYSSKKGWKKGDAQSFATQLQDTTNKVNSAYMDLQHTNEAPSNFVNTDVPYENLNLLDLLPGTGFINYRRAQMISTHKRTEIVVKTVSDDSPARLATLQADEVRMLSALTSNVNIVQFLGRCNKVPNLLCYEFVNGTRLGNYLKENFQPSKIHQYGNTKQNRFHVAEKGSVENLPKIALQIAHGMKYLTAQKFLHPGLRSEKIIIDVSGQCKLYDFVSKDSAKDIMAILWDKTVPYQWMPPEYLFLENLDPSADVWSFGVVLWEIFSHGARPYDGKARSEVERGIREKKYLSMPNNCPGAIWQMTLDCWEQSPVERPSFDHLYLQLSHMCNDNKEYDEIHST